MAAARRRTQERREPVLDDDDAGRGPERVTEQPAEPSRRAAARAEKRAQGRTAKPANDASAPGRKSESKPRRKARGRGARGGRGGGRGALRSLLYWGAVAALWCVIAAVGVVAWVGMHLPPIHSLEIPKRPPTVQVVGLGGRLLATRGDMGGSAIPLAEMPPHLPKAFIAIEDRRFYSHYGIDPIGLVRAVVANILRKGISQGGSTLTQQLAKNLFLTQERTLTRKLEEVVLALWLEHKFSKAEILELYLNRVYFGSGAYGVEGAALRYFGKSARQVTLGESAMLAGLVKSPSRLAPTHNYDAAERRAQLVLGAMHDAGLVTADQVKVALVSPPRVVKIGGGTANYVADWVMDVLNDLIGRVEDDLVVDTTIDTGLQAVAEKAVIDEIAQKGEKFGVEQGALVAMTPDGAVRALVGGRNYAESQFNRAVTAKRQPGSAFKPFVYLTALERGLTPDTLREDKPIAVKGWKPENYGREYFGPVTLRQALAQSLNTVSVRLTLEFGPTAVVRTAYRLGISSKLEANASIALGTSEVSVLELVTAYVPFANGGNAVVPHVVENVRTLDGRTVYARPSGMLGRVIEPRMVAMMNQMMRETLVSGTARKADLPGWTAAGKTGTSQDFRDAWFVGFTSRLVTAVWLGNDDSSPTRKATGGGLPVEAWSRFMKAAHQGVPPEELPGVSPGLFSGVTMAGTSSPAPPAPVQSAMAGGRAPVPQSGSGIDTWLMDKLFRRR